MLSVSASAAPLRDALVHSRHFILRPPHVLSDADKAALASRGITIESALSAGRYLIRVAPGASSDLNDTTPVTAETKIHRGALGEISSGKPLARVNVLFYPSVPFELAKEAIENAGGMLEDPLQSDFVFQRIAARVPSAAMLDLARDERVMIVYGPMNLRPISDNRDSALLSRIDVVQTAPYNLSGQGVVLSYFELAAADSTHLEFGGRLTTHITGGGSSNVFHATHTAGTMIATGVDPAAKGMAPNASLHEYDVNDDALLTRKASLHSTIFSVADNNSWGFILGWHAESTWTWYGGDEYYGAYDVAYVAPLDKITRENGLLMVHSAGNDAQTIGPQSAPFAHTHAFESGTYCYSTNGGGNDCPSPCSAGLPFCEITHHPQITTLLPPPWVSIGLMASAKNVIAVGAVDTTKSVAAFSSRGPTRDGRVKPDLVAKGVATYSTEPGNNYGVMSGTSMAAPVVTGTAALLTELWRRMFVGADPAPAVLKTVMIAGAEDAGNVGPDYSYGFGLLNAQASADLIIGDGARGRRIKIASIQPNTTFETNTTISAPQSLRVVLGWSDPEVVMFPADGFATTALVNDLDLQVIDPVATRSCRTFSIPRIRLRRRRAE